LSPLRSWECVNYHQILCLFIANFDIPFFPHILLLFHFSPYFISLLPPSIFYLGLGFWISIITCFAFIDTLILNRVPSSGLYGNYSLGSISCVRKLLWFVLRLYLTSFLISQKLEPTIFIPILFIKHIFFKTKAYCIATIKAKINCG